MKNFIDILNRLKLALGVSMDSEVADFLEMKQSAFAGRKKRNSFPDEQLRLVAAKHGDLNLDVEYILTGDSDYHQQIIRAKDEYLELSALYYQQQKDSKAEKIQLSIFPEPNNANIVVDITDDELQLISNFRKSDLQGQTLILEIAKLIRQNSNNQESEY
ncbi:helix-turn-helix domain containing protein [Moraxella bovis]|uniref:helix-turn-helix domain containing protein n=1 Tax=Moraxella bovis TaxID=476 RepID=UPI0022263314|nr:helix-turn-helix domain containing protein [Moraxella bovis]UZA23865.1 helix-turn-helix domain containing protein [Moraxella bovis]UZA30118.1 helix-turn-helix domain containing protein [Moraxella bovis]